MTDIDLYREIGTWLNRYHRRKWAYTGLLKDFQHDLWILLINKEQTTLSYIKQHCFHYPINAMRHNYYKRKKEDFSPLEVVLLEDGVPVTDFEDNSFNPEYEFPPVVKKTKLRKHKDARRVRITYLNGESEEYDSVAILADHLGVHRNSVRRQIKIPTAQRFTKRKMSHIKIIEYVD